MHTELLHIDVPAAIEQSPLKPKPYLSKLCIALMVIGVAAFAAALLGSYPPAIVWAVYYQNVIFWMGLAAGAVIGAVIMQIVRARWSPPVRRIAEANVAFLPWAFFLFLGTYFGKWYLFPWAKGPMPGREQWMEPNFVYLRFTLLFGIFFYLLYRYVRLSLRGDIGFVREHAPNREKWSGLPYVTLVRGWKGSEQELLPIQRKLSIWGPILVILYSIVYTIFATEMIVGMDTVWFSNMFGGFQFIGNVYAGWAVMVLIALYLARNYKAYDKILTQRQTWDLGMLMLGFSMLWAYTFFAQFLPQWYANMPEETQWLILRTREQPWMRIGWITFTLGFILPFILLLSEDVKKAPKAITVVSLVVIFGIWLEKYVIVMPQITPDRVPFGLLDIAIFLGFAGLYGLSLQNFLRKFPFVPVSHPLTHDSNEW